MVEVLFVKDELKGEQTKKNEIERENISDLVWMKAKKYTIRRGLGESYKSYTTSHWVRSQNRQYAGLHGDIHWKIKDPIRRRFISQTQSCQVKVSTWPIMAKAYANFTSRGSKN